MRFSWWQGGLHVEPDSDGERQMLTVLYEALQCADLGNEVLPGPSGAVDGNDE